MHSDVLIIPCETQAREFDAKLLLACFAAERGFSVIVGSKKEINKRIGSLPRSIFVSKSLTKRNLLNYELLDRLGHSVICGDEEALVYASPDSYLHHKVAAATLGKARSLLAWGPQNEQLWQNYAGYEGSPIHVTGNARMDLLRPELRPLFDDAVARLRQRFGRFILINTNFSRLNHYFPGQSRQRRALESGPPVRGVDLGRGLAAHKARLYESFLQMVPAVAAACPDSTVIVRPHPSERQETWREVTRECKNVEVLHEGSVVPWLLASEAMIHNGCQTAVEAYLLGAPAIAYQPATSEDFDLQLPNLLSHRAFEQASLISMLREQLRGKLERSPADVAKQEELIDQYVAARSGPFASERIMAVVEAFAADPGLGPLPPLPSRVLARVVAHGRGLLQRIEAYWPGHHNNRVFLRHMFAGASLAFVQERIATYGNLLGRFGEVRARERHPNVFLIDVA
ncbi:MAG: surface carbohydrate biosynthesis protein [Myxococcota bacterium]|nr:surface carbohydrate biosynthesis protein [Myxococcota bacterium]